MTLDADGLWQLIPAIHRLRDAERGSLRALVEVVAREAGVVADDIDRLYDDWFVESCAEWVVPYLGELLGAPPLAPLDPEAGVSRRAFVANTLRYRRRKGTVPVLEQIARDVTGWPARAVEYFPRLAQSAHLEHLRAEHPALADLRAGDLHELADGPFDPTPRTFEARSIRAGRGRHAIEHIGLWLWRLEAYRLRLAEPFPVTHPDDGKAGCWLLQPPALTGQLVNPGRAETDILHIAREEDVPAALRRLPLFHELRDLAAGRAPATHWFAGALEPTSRWFAEEAAPLAVRVAMDPGDPLEALPPTRLRVCHLGAWGRPPQPAPGESFVVHVDPVLGRLAFPEDIEPAEVRVDFAYAAGGDVGAGPYDRRGRAALPDTVTWQAGVTRLEPADPARRIFATLKEALDLFRDEGAGQSGLILVMDNGRYDEALTVALPPDSTLAIVAAAWPARLKPGGAVGETVRLPGVADPNGLRPCLLGDIEVVAEGGPGDRRLALDGLWIDGQLALAAEGLVEATLAHCTLVPTKGGITVDATLAGLLLHARRCMLGPISLPAAESRLAVESSILDDAGAAAAVSAADAAVTLDRSTVLGKIEVRELEASETLLMAPATAARRQVGCVRFSFVAPGSTTPRRYRCQPDLATKDLPLAQIPAATIRVTPAFESLAFGQPAYALLAPWCAREIREGGEDEREMGAMGLVETARRLANLERALADYIRFGREAGLLDAR